MEWIERQRENYEARLEAISNIVVCTCDICGKEMKHGEGAYIIPSKDFCICENCYEDCFTYTELCADEDEIANVKYTITAEF